MPKDTGDLLQGTLGMIILKALAAGDMHGYGIARWLEQVTGEILRIEEGSLYPALRRLEDRGLIASRWGISDHNRRARFYALTTAGRQQLTGDASTWMRFAGAVTLVLRAEPALA
jgi:PadR family transcriptional regulator, regulatory protein PadR